MPRLLAEPDQQKPVELVDTPFFPQQRYQCGPAALATVLRDSDVDIEPESLVDEVYLPARHGSLQAEMIGAARRYHRIPYLIETDFPSLLAELNAGRPVLVLQNLGLDALPVWHYAVVIGIEPDTETMILRSGTKKRLTMSVARFVNSWRRSQSWGFIALKPGELPAVMDAGRYLRAVARSEKALTPVELQTAYSAAITRWPDAAGAFFGLARSQQLGGRPDLAAETYRDLLKQRPGNPAIMNNLAQAELQRGCKNAAKSIIERALSTLPPNDTLRHTLEDTRKEIVNATPKPRIGSACKAYP